MASAMAPYFHHTSELWVLASATVCDTKDVASVLPVARPSIIDEILSGLSTLQSVLKLRGSFRRLATRQGKLICKFKAAYPETWSLEDCGEMAQLLDALIEDENMVLTSSLASPKAALMWWQNSLRILGEQTAELEQICIRLDALSVPEKTLPGDTDYAEFMSVLAVPIEHDLFPYVDERRVRSLA